MTKWYLLQQYKDGSISETITEFIILNYGEKIHIVISKDAEMTFDKI